MADCLACFGQGLFAKLSIAGAVSLSRAGKRRNGLHAPRALAKYLLRSGNGARRRLPVQKSPGTFTGRRPSPGPLLKDGIDLRLHTLDLTGARPGLGWSVEQEKHSNDCEAGNAAPNSATAHEASCPSVQPRVAHDSSWFKRTAALLGAEQQERARRPGNR